MLSKSELYRLLEKREALSSSEAQVLGKLLEEYPYFQACVLRYAVDRAIKQQSQEHREQVLGHAAALLPNSILLYERLHGEEPLGVVLPGAGGADAVPAQDASQQPVVERALPDAEQPLPTGATGAEDVAGQEEVYEPEETPLDEPTTPVEQSPEAGPEAALVEGVRSASTVPPNEGAHEPTQPMELDLTDVLNRSLSAAVPGLAPTLYTMGEAKSSLSPEDIDFINGELNAQMPEQVKEAPASSATAQQQELIDSFLENLDALIVKVRTQAEEDEAHHVVPRNLAADQAALDTDIASERLAELLAQKGQTAQAISMYRELMQRNPEKSAYFAQAIVRLGGTPNA